MPKYTHKAVTKRNMRANTRRHTSRAKHLLKIENEVQAAAIVAHRMARAAQRAGVRVPHADPMDVEINLPQAVAILEEVIDDLDHPVPIRREIERQVANVERRGLNCKFTIRLRTLFHVLLTILITYGASFKPMFAPPRDPSFFDTAAGYFSLAGTIGPWLSLESAGTYTLCGIGTQFVGGVARGASALSGHYPMSSNNVKREALKFMEYLPGPAGYYLMSKRLGGVGALTHNTLNKLSSKKLQDIDFKNIGEVVSPLTKAAVDVAIEKGHKLNSKTEKEVLNELSRNIIGIHAK